MTSNDSSSLILAKLENRKAELNKLLDSSKDELQKIEYALKMFDNPGATRSHGVELQLSDAGNLKNVHETLLEFLRKHGQIAAASGMAEALYTFRLSITVSQLKRRFSVTTSAMYKNHTPPLLIDSGFRNKNREILWALPKWIINDELLDDFKEKE